mgnify:CR=1 FL=1
MLGFTGKWRGHRVTIHGSGMGMPSLSIYANELIRDYGAQTLIRIGSCGAMQRHVRVRNLSNGRSIIVKVNDRGPFVHNRIIDLSYAAAMKLDMVTSGTSLVEVEAISFDDPPGDRPVRATTTPEPAPPAPAAPAPQRIDEDHIFLQVGAFGSRDNAERRLSTLKDASILTAFIVEDTSVSPALYRVRIGPIRGIVQYDIIVEELENLGIADPYLINE